MREYSKYPSFLPIRIWQHSRGSTAKQRKWETRATLSRSRSHFDVNASCGKHWWNSPVILSTASFFHQCFHCTSTDSRQTPDPASFPLLSLRGIRSTGGEVLLLRCLPMYYDFTFPFLSDDFWSPISAGFFTPQKIPSLYTQSSTPKCCTFQKKFLRFVYMYNFAIIKL